MSSWQLEVLAECFKALPKADRKRLKYHLENKTPIFCGRNANAYFFSPKTGFA